MDSYYADLTTNALNEAAKKITEAAQYAEDAQADARIYVGILRLRNGVNNRIKEVLAARQRKQK